MTSEQLRRFVEIRNASGFSSNLQFAIDASEAGFDVAELGKPIKRHKGGYRWETPAGILIEHPSGHCELLD